MNLDDYSLLIRDCLPSENPFPYGSLCRFLFEDLSEMVSSYLDDATVFFQKNDIVNQYAALAYAHGWLDAGIFLGYLPGHSLTCDFCQEAFISQRSEALMEKMNRYERMLMVASESVILSASTGSPAHSAAVTIREKVETGLKTGISYRIHERPASALALYSYWYGWLDTAVRAGILRIVNHPDLFTTEL